MNLHFPTAMKPNFPTLLLAATLLSSTAILRAQAQADVHAESNKPMDMTLPPSYEASILRQKEGRAVLLPTMFLFKIVAGKLECADNPEGADPEYLSREEIKHLSFKLPQDMVEALASYDAGEFAQALPMLQSVVRRYNPLRSLEGSQVERAEILLMDCLRRTKKTAELKDALAVAKPENYGDLGKQYLKVFAAWDAYAAKDWKRIEALSRDIDTLTPGTPAAEMAFLRAEALRRLERKEEALAEYHRAMAMDFTRSRDLFGDAAIAALEVYNELPPVKDFFDRFGSPDYNPEAAYVVPAKEAALLAHLVRSMQPGGRALPTALSKFAKAFDDLSKEQKSKPEAKKDAKEP